MNTCCCRLLDVRLYFEKANKILDENSFWGSMLLLPPGGSSFLFYSRQLMFSGRIEPIPTFLVVSTQRNSSRLQIAFTEVLRNRLHGNHKRAPECNQNGTAVSYMWWERVWGGMDCILRSGESQICVFNIKTKLILKKNYLMVANTQLCTLNMSS